MGNIDAYSSSALAQVAYVSADEWLHVTQARAGPWRACIARLAELSHGGSCDAREGGDKRDKC